MHAERKPRIILADDHTLMTEALRHLLQTDFEVVATVSDGRALLQVAAELRPDLVVVDIGMPVLNGLDAGEQLKALQPNVKVIYLTQNREPRIAIDAFRRKASGYLLKDSAGAELIAAIREALRGGHYISPRIAAELPDDWLTQHADRSPSPPFSSTAARDLSLREREVLQLLAEGRSMKEVAAVLDISPRTVEFHKYRIMDAIGVRTTAELTQYAIKHGLITP